MMMVMRNTLHQYECRRNCFDELKLQVKMSSSEICAKTSYIIVYYPKDNSARAYVAALKYVDRIVRVRNGYGVKALYGDFNSTHLDQNVLGALRGDLGIEFEATPPYMHWPSAYAKVYMRVMKLRHACAFST
jgi:hypothetical protein